MGVDEESSARTTGSMHFSKLHQGHSEVVCCTVPFQSKSRILDGAFGIRSHCGRTPLRLRCDLTLPPTDPAPSNTNQGRTPGRCDPSEHRLISIGIEPEGITPH